FAHWLRASEGGGVKTPDRVSLAAYEVGAERAAIRYIQSDEPIAYTNGLLKTTIHLSSGIVEALDDAQLRAVIAHEYAHVVRKDNLAIFIALTLRDFLFIFPLGHLLFAKFMRQKEHAADDMAVELTGDSVGLADAIVKVARLRSSGKRLCPAYATFFPEKASVRERVVRLLGSGQAGEIGKVRAVVATTATILIVGLLAGVATAQPSVKVGLSKACQVRQDCIRQGAACCPKK
ncbi:MAG: M56 family metallopeptidase, partial [Chloroflexi bacterium]|nr:M56 family metallopeptidase [Chloroflexota bacterium]